MAAAKALSDQVIRYSYLWRNEHLQGREEGVKDPSLRDRDIGDALFQRKGTCHSRARDA